MKSFTLSRLKALWRPVHAESRTGFPPSKVLSAASVNVRLRHAWLTVLVHGDSFLLDPFGYMQALCWRARGLKLRSRNRLAALMGRSSRAYRLWILRIEPKVHSQLLARQVPRLGEVIAVVDGNGTAGSLAETLASLADAEHTGRTVVVGSGSVHEATTVAGPSDLARVVSESGSWLCMVRAGDLVVPSALAIYARVADEEAWVVYADDDLDSGGDRHSPHFKCSWNPELFEHHDFVTGSAIVRITPDMLANLDGENWIEQLTRRAIDRGPAPVHLPAVLHHRKRRPEPIVPAKPASILPNAAPTVTIIIPTRDQESYLRKAVAGVRRTAYPNIELIVVDNDSTEPGVLSYLASLRVEGAIVVPQPGAFNFSALNNAAARRARGEILCFLNNDIEIVEPDWLALLVRQATRETIGAVGGRLLYPDGSVQHAGVVTGVGGGAAHAHRNLGEQDTGYFLRDRLPQRVSAVTAACLVVSKNKFVAVGGFNEIDFAVAFNDVDLCLKLNARGWQSFYEPRAVLIHHESKSRGSDSRKDNRARFAAELQALKRHWGTDTIRDPYHHPQLSPFTEQFFVAV